MEEKMKIRMAFGTFASSFVLLSFVFLKSFSISAYYVITYPVTFFNNFLLAFSNVGSGGAIISSLVGILAFAIPFISLVLAFSILVYYGVKFGEDKKLGMFSALVSAVGGLIILGPSVTVIMFSIGLVVSGSLVTQISVMYYEELKKWKKFRVGSKVAGKIFLILNIMLLIALVFDVMQNVNEYDNFYTEEAKNVIMSIMPDMNSDDMIGVEGFDMLSPQQQDEMRRRLSNLTESQKDMINSQIDEMLKSEKMHALIVFSIFLMPFMIFTLLETLRIVVLSPVSGVISAITLSKIK